MGDTSSPAPALPQAKPDSPVAERLKDSNESNVDSSKSEKWPFSEPKPMREDQIKNAVNFLSHPSVRGTPMVQRFSFLERKGLTREEIDEAFRRCPDPPTTSEGGKSLVRTEGRVPTQAQAGEYHQTVAPRQQQPGQQYGTQLPSSIVPVRAAPTWSQLILGASLIAAAGVGTGYFLQKVLAPRLKRWLRDMLIEEEKPTGRRGEEQGKGPKLTPLEEAVSAAAAAANAAASAAAEVANTSREVIKLQTEEWQHFKSLVNNLDNKTEELKGTLALISKDFQGGQKGAVSTIPVLGEDTMNYRGMPKPYQRTPSPAEQVQTKQGLHAVQSINGVEKSYSNGHSTSLSSHVSQAEDEPWWQRKKVDVEHVSQSEEEPWWQRKKVEVETYSSPNKFVESTLQISEMDSELNQEIGTMGVWGSTQNRSGPLGRPGWVPPPVPQTVMPGAASAIRYQKPASIDKAKETYVSEEKDMELRQPSGFNASSSIRLQNAISLGEAVKAKVVTEDSPKKQDEAKLVTSSAGWYQRTAVADGAERVYASDEKDVGSQQQQLFGKPGRSGVSSMSTLQHSVKGDESRHTNAMEDALLDRANLRVVAEEKETTFELPKMSEEIEDAVE